MSRIGNRELNIPSSVTVSVDGNKVTIKGPKGELSTVINEGITVTVDNEILKVERKDDSIKNFHGTVNANIANMIKGVTEGFEKRLEAVGVGYRFTIKGNILDVAAGYSHHIEKEIPSELKVESVSNTEITISGCDKKKVGDFAAEIRDIRRPEPYKGKGIRYKDEHIRRREGKKASK